MENMGIGIEKIAQETLQAIADRIKNLTKLNIIVAGKTGVGKSTLINGVFKENLASTGIGRPVTDHMQKYSKRDMPLNIYDTRGLELGAEVQKQVKQEVNSTIRSSLAKGDINEAIHCVWYCINAASNRIEPEEIEWIRELSEENLINSVPIIVILTQAISKKNTEDLKRVLENENLKVAQIVPVLVEDYKIDEEYTKRAYGLDTLIQIMGEVLPEELLDTLQNVQIASLAEKRRAAFACVNKAVALTVAEGATPVPFSDALMLVPTQIGMIASINAIFGFDVNRSILVGFFSATLGAGATTYIGRSIVSNILKFIPGAGTLSGGIVSASTAGIMTAALGRVYIFLMECVYKGEMNIEDIASEEVKNKTTRWFTEQLSGERIFA